MPEIRCIIADDEALVCDRLHDLLSGYPDFVICASCKDGVATVQAVEQHQPDLLFLDIRMPKADGFAVLDLLHSEELLVVFITAFDQYAIKAFEYAAFDYLVKPISRARFERTIQRLRQAVRQAATAPAYLLIREEGRLLKIKQQDVSHLEAADNYVKVYVGEQIYRKRITLEKLVEELSPAGMVRVHRSYAVNPAQVQDMARIYRGDYLIRLQNGRVVPSSKSYRAAVLQLMG